MKYCVIKVGGAAPGTLRGPVLLPGAVGGALQARTGQRTAFALWDTDLETELL